MANSAESSPSFVPDDQLRARDNSGGPGFTPHSADWDDGGRVTGPKSYLGGNSMGKGKGKGKGGGC